MRRLLRETTLDEWLHLLPPLGILAWAWLRAWALNTGALRLTALALAVVDVGLWRGWW